MTCIKLAVLGLGAVGKSALSIRFVQGTFVADYEPTIQNTYRKTVTVDGKTYAIDILDTAGMDSNDAMKPAIYRGRDCFLLVYSITDRASFDKVKEIHADLRRVLDKPVVPCVICGNKSDLEAGRQISVQEAKDVANRFQAAFVETSALMGTNVAEAMVSVVRTFLKAQSGATQKKPGKTRCILT
jgi:small GTP-binding protein